MCFGMDFYQATLLHPENSTNEILVYSAMLFCFEMLLVDTVTFIPNFHVRTYFSQACHFLMQTHDQKCLLIESMDYTKQ